MNHLGASAESLTAYLPIDRCLALLRGEHLSDRTEGAVLFADISGFTALAEALVHEAGRLRGAEELTHQLNRVYSSLIAAVHTYQGSVIGFSGDAITCWFGQELLIGQQIVHDGRAGLRAVTAAAAMQAVMQQFAHISIPTGASVSLVVKVAVVSGPVRRYVVGSPEHGLVDVLAGRTLDEVATAEQLAGPGEIVVAADVVDQAGDGAAAVSTWRADAATGKRFAVLAAVRSLLAPTPWPGIVAGDREEALFRPWLLPDVYARLRSGQGQFLAELRPAAALFLSFAGIDHDADDAAGDKLDAVVRWVQQIVGRYEGALIQVTLGDKGSYLYAAFGAPRAHDDDPARAVGAAMELIAAPQHLSFLRDVRIGVTMGRMRTGAYGSPERRTYGVLGDKTNLAARLMVASQPGQILCDEDLCRSASNRWVFEALPPVRVKGKAEPVAICQPLRRAESTALRAPSTLGPLIGRQAELVRLGRGLDAVAAGQHRVLVIEGEAGIGKSRLAMELGLMGRVQGMHVLAGAGQSIEQHTPYRAWRDVLHDFFSLSAVLDPQEQYALVRQQVASLAPSQLEWLPLLDDVLGLGWADSEQTASLAPELRRQILFNLLCALVQARAERQPLVVVLEDVQWLDQLSWSLAAALAGDARLDGSPLLLVFVTRPAADTDSFAGALAALRSLPQAETLTLDTLAPDETVALAASRLRLPVEGLPDEVALLVRTRSQGNPFFAVELVFALRDHGLIRVEPDPDRTGDPLPNYCVLAGDLSQFAQALPDTIQGLVLARIDRLPAERQLALKVAAVIGRTFGYEPLLYVMRASSSQVAQALREHLDALAQNDLTDVETPEPDLSYLFSHIITQEVAYQTLLFAQRQELHRRAAEWYEVSFDGQAPQGPHARLAPYYPLLVYHYRMAEDPAAERWYARLAGEHAARQFATIEAVIYLSRALELTPIIDAIRERFELLLARERVFDVQADRVRQQEDLAALEALAAQLGDPLAQAEVELRKARYFEYLGDFVRAFAAVDQGLRNAPPSVLEAVALKIMAAGLYFRQGRHREALDWCQQALDTADLPGVHPMRAHAEGLIGVIYTYLGRAAEALAPLELALNQYIQLEELPGQFDVCGNLGLVLFLRAGPGDWKRAYGYLRQAQALAERMGDAERKARISNNLGWLAYCLGDAGQAIEHYSFSLQTWTASGGRVMSAIVRTNLAAAELAYGDTGRALSYLDEAVAALEEAGARGQLAETRRYLALAHLAAGDQDAARDAAVTALALAREAEAPLDEAGAQRVLGQIALAAGDAGAATAALEASRGLLADQGNRYELAQTQASLAEALLAQERRQEARALLVEAVEVLAELDASRELKHVSELLQRL